MKRKIALLLLIFSIIFVGSQAQAYLDLTTIGSSGWLDNAFFAQNDITGAGSGNINSFVRLDPKRPRNLSTPEGYNTSGRLQGNPKFYFDEDNSVHTRDLLLSEIPVVTFEDQQGLLTEYREFILDINQASCGSDDNCTTSLISLNKVNIYLSSVGGSLEQNLSDLGSEIFQLSSSDNWIKLDHDIAQGSGKTDMFMYVPNSYFNIVNNDYVYLYSMFGLNYPNNAGYEEWAVRTPIQTFDNGITEIPTTPEPASLILFAAGLLGAALKKRFV